MSMNPNSWKKQIYLAKFVGQDKNGIKTYQEPISIRLNHQPVNAETAQKEVGVLSSGVQKALVNKGTREFELFNIDQDEQSLVYLDGANPTNELVNGMNANYEVISIRHFNLTKHIYLKRIGTQ